LDWKRAVCSALCILGISQTSLAASEGSADRPAPAWGGEAEVGILMTRGNTHTDTQNIKLGLQHTKGAWEHKLKLAYLRTEESGVVSADRYGVDFRSTYQFKVKSYAFGALRYEDDRFAGFDRRTTEVAGYGRKLIDDKSLRWNAETGLGARQTAYTDNTRTDEGIVRLATKLEWAITGTSAFTQEVFVERGSANTLTQSTSALKVKINSSLAMKLSINVQDNSKVPVGKKHTDTQTALTLVYDI